MIILFIILTAIFCVLLIINFVATANLQSDLNKLEDRHKKLYKRLFGDCLFDSASCFGQVDKRFVKLIKEIDENTTRLDNRIDDTVVRSGELERHLGIKYEKKIITTNGVEKDVSKYVRSGRR